MGNYKVIGLDMMEQSQLRRRVERWREQPALAHDFIGRILSESGDTPPRFEAAKWELAVYPLFYYLWTAENKPDKIDTVFERGKAEARKRGLPPEFEEDFVTALNAEVDLLIEDVAYLIFVEAKIKPRFSTKNSIGQLARQLAQGHVLGDLIDKRFILATLGPQGGARPTGPLALNSRERDFLDSLGVRETELKVPGLPWDTTSTSPGSD